MRKHAYGGLAAIAVGAGLALGVPALPAVGQISPPSIMSVRLGGQATLVAKGAALSVPVQVRCPASSPFQSLSVQVTQRAGSKIANGYGGTNDFACTGATQTVTVVVQAQSIPFKKGPAAGQASPARRSATPGRSTSTTNCRPGRPDATPVAG